MIGLFDPSPPRGLRPMGLEPCWEHGHNMTTTVFPYGAEGAGIETGTMPKRKPYAMGWADSAQTHLGPGGHWKVERDEGHCSWRSKCAPRKSPMWSSASRKGRGKVQLSLECNVTLLLPPSQQEVAGMLEGLW